MQNLKHLEKQSFAKHILKYSNNPMMSVLDHIGILNLFCLFGQTAPLTVVLRVKSKGLQCVIV